MLKRKSWNEFRDTGLLWMINSMLHLFGWCIVIEGNSESGFTGAYPARTNFRGFSEKSNTNNYRKITEYMVNKSSELMNDFNDNGDE